MANARLFRRNGSVQLLRILWAQLQPS